MTDLVGETPPRARSRSRELNRLNVVVRRAQHELRVTRAELHAVHCELSVTRAELQATERRVDELETVVRQHNRKLNQLKDEINAMIFSLLPDGTPMHRREDATDGVPLTSGSLHPNPDN